MKIYVLVEGPSEREFLDAWAPRAFPGHTFKVLVHQGKGRLPRKTQDMPVPRARGMLDLLPATLRAFGESLDRDSEAVLVLVDADEDDCRKLKADLTAMAATIDPCPRVIFRIAVEETEAFYLGDLAGLRSAFPDADMPKARAYANDTVCRTAELFDAVVRDGSMNKVGWARRMGAKLTTDPAKSRSPSFKALWAGIAKLVAHTPAKPKPSRKFRHVASTAKDRISRTRRRP